MPHNNPWFLITHEEITGIQDQLLSLRQELRDEQRVTGEGIVGILKEVRDRRP
jgi:hypothetical protein